MTTEPTTTWSTGSMGVKPSRTASVPIAATSAPPATAMPVVVEMPRRSKFLADLSFASSVIRRPLNASPVPAGDLTLSDSNCRIEGERLEMGRERRKSQCLHTNNALL
jgi:hypothetical protein